MLTEAQIRLALRDCFDPELRISVVDLGLIDQLHLTPDPDAPGAGIPGVPPRFRVRLMLLSRGEELDPVLRAIVGNRLAGLETLSAAEVTTSPTPWTHAHLSANGRRLLGLPDPHFPILAGGGAS